MKTSKTSIDAYSARLPLVVGFSTIALLVGGIGTWSVETEISGAVVAPGVIQVETERQVVQHPDGGVVGQILARDGDHVETGDVLLRLDGIYLRSELVVVETQLSELFARRARLEAERDEAATPEFNGIPKYETITDDEIREKTEGQKSLFDARRNSLEQEQRLLSKQQSQIDRQIEGLRAQLDGLARQKKLVESELKTLQLLLERGLVQASRVLALEREDARLQGEIGQLSANVAEAETRISALRIEIVHLSNRRREDAIGELRDVQNSEIELVERRLGLIEKLSRLDVRSPVSGVVFGSHVLALNSVVRAAEPMMYIVPEDQPLEVSAKIEPTDIDQVFIGQPVNLMFTAFNRRTTPEVPGVVVRVSADAISDEHSGRQFYEAIVLPDAMALSGLPNVTLIPGMPVETFLRTEERTPLSYLTQPLWVFFSRAFRGE